MAAFGFRPFRLWISFTTFLGGVLLEGLLPVCAMPPKRSIPESYSFYIGLKRLGRRQANSLEGQPAKRANGSNAGVSPLPQKRPTMRSLSFDLKARTLRMDSSSRDLASKGAGAPKHDEAVPPEDSDTRRSLPLRQEPGQGGDPLATARERGRCPTTCRAGRVQSVGTEGTILR